MTGNIEKVEGLLDGTFRISLTTRSKPHLEALTDKVVEISIKEHKAHRSLDANAYYWVLVGKLAEKLNTSKTALHNILLGRYGQPWIIEGKVAKVVIPETEDKAKEVEESPVFHLRATTDVREGKDGVTYRTYHLLRGSSTYDTREMSELIKGLVSECKECGIETLTPEELERMMENYAEKQTKQSV